MEPGVVYARGTRFRWEGHADPAGKRFVPRTVPTFLLAPVLVIVGEVPRPIEVGPLVTDHLRPRVIPFFGGGATFRSHCPLPQWRWDVPGRPGARTSRLPSGTVIASATRRCHHSRQAA